jgi:hypothetical protein
LNKIIIIIVLTLISITIIADDIIPQEVYQEGARKFPAGADIFKAIKLDDPDAWKAGRDEAVGRMGGIFKEVGAVLQRGDKWSATLYVNDPKAPRKTIVDREKVSINNFDYLIVATKDGVTVTDIKTGYNMELKKKTR